MEFYGSRFRIVGNINGWFFCVWRAKEGWAASWVHSGQVSTQAAGPLVMLFPPDVFDNVESWSERWRRGKPKGLWTFVGRQIVRLRSDKNSLLG